MGSEVLAYTEVAYNILVENGQYASIFNKGGENVLAKAGQLNKGLLRELVWLKSKNDYIKLDQILLMEREFTFW